MLSSQYRAAQGLYNGDIPFGYRSTGQKSPPEFDPDEFPGLRMIGELRMAGKTAEQIADAVRMHLALVQTIPAGTWGFAGRPAHTEASAWLGRPLADPEAGLPQLVLRYLAAFGPASLQDIQKWSGLTKLQQTIEVLRPELLTFRDEQGRELFDLPQAPRPEACTPAPVRFLPEFDNLLLSYAKRGRIMSDVYYPAVFVNSGLIRATFLVDGFVRGVWRVERRPASATLVIEPFEPLSDQVRHDLLEEGERLVRFVADEAEMFEVQFN